MDLIAQTAAAIICIIKESCITTVPMTAVMVTLFYCTKPTTVVKMDFIVRTSQINQWRTAQAQDAMAWKYFLHVNNALQNYHSQFTSIKVKPLLSGTKLFWK